MGFPFPHYSIPFRREYGRITDQALSDQHLVLYNASGTHIAATRVNRDDLPARFIVDHKLYWFNCKTVEEADYLTAILNSRDVNTAIKPFQSTGQQGQRDIHKKPLELPIPPFNSENDVHQKLTALGKQARKKAAKFVADGGLPKPIGRRRTRVREDLSEIIDEIDAVVRALVF